MNRTFLPKDRRIRWVISLFIVWNVFVITLTNTQTMIAPWSVVRLFVPYARLTRVMQRWALFSPEPRRYVHSYFFRIRFKNGMETKWQRPYPPRWGFFARHHSSHWQKFDTASNHMEDSQLWPDLAAWIGRKFANPENPPVEIQLIRHSADIPPPSPSGNVMAPASTLVFKDRVVFDYFPETGEWHR